MTLGNVLFLYAISRGAVASEHTDSLQTSALRLEQTARRRNENTPSSALSCAVNCVNMFTLTVANFYPCHTFDVYILDFKQKKSLNRLLLNDCLEFIYLGNHEN